MVPAFLIAIAAAPGLFAWWSGRRLLARGEDPAPAELLLQEHGRLLQVAGGTIALLLLIPQPVPWAVPLAILAALLGSFPARRTIFEEEWSLATYLGWTSRLLLAVGGFWALLAITPALILEAGAWRWLAAGALGLVLAAWNLRYAQLFRWLVGATPLTDDDLASELAAIVQRSGIEPAPNLFRFSFPGGRIANAFAFPAEPSVVLTDDLLTLLTPAERVAIFAHQVAHLEHWTRARLREANAVFLGAIALAVIGVPLLLAWQPEWAAYITGLWMVAVFGAMALRTLGPQAHETQCDRRAVALCGDSEAVATALARLSIASRLPGRWALEPTAVDPSLARRIRTIRAAAGTPLPSLDRPTVLVGELPGTFVIFEEEGVTWIEGGPTDAGRDAATIRSGAASARSLRYSELGELRLRARLRESPALVATASSGRSWTVPLRRYEAATAQAVLAIVDLRLGPRVQLTPTAFVRGLGAVLIVLSLGSPARLILLVAGLLATLLPGRATLVALTAAALGAVAVDLQPVAPNLTAIDVALTAAACAALWFLVRPPSPPRPTRWQVTAVAAVLASATLLAWATILGPGLFDRPLLDIIEFAHHQPNALVGLLALGATLLVLAQPGRLRWTGGAVLALGLGLTVFVGPVAEVVGFDPAPAAIQWTEGRVQLERQVRVEGEATRLRLSPSLARYAVRLVRRGGGGPAFTVAPFGSEGRMVKADDLVFVDDDRLLTLVRREASLELRIDDPADTSGEAWLAVLPKLDDVALEVDTAGTWRVVGVDPSSDEAVAMSGVVGSHGFRQWRWKPVVGDLERLWTTQGGEAYAHVLRDAGRSGALALLAPLLALPRPVEHQIWNFGMGQRRRLVVFAVSLRCLSPSTADGSLICFGYGRTRTRAWRVNAITGGAQTVAVLNAPVWRGAAGRDGRFVTLTGRDAAVWVDPAGGRGIRLTLPQTVGRPIELVPVGEGLAVLSASSGEATVSLYDLR